MGMGDAKLVLSDAQAITATALSTNYIDVKEIVEAGRGTPLFLEIWLDTAFTSAANVLVLDLLTSSGIPASTDIAMTLIDSIAASAMGTPGLLVKTALPALGLEDHISVHYYCETNLAAGAITARVTLGP